MKSVLTGLLLIQISSLSLEYSDDLGLEESVVVSILESKKKCADKENSTTYSNEIDQRCCREIVINHCLEQSHGLSIDTALFLAPILKFECQSHLSDTKSKCNVDTSKFGYKIVTYSRSYLIVWAKIFPRSKIGEVPHGGDYCCFKQNLCNHYDKNFLGKCKTFEVKAPAHDHDYCQCLNIHGYDKYACENHTQSCTIMDFDLQAATPLGNATESNVRRADYRGFWIFLVIMLLVNCSFYYCCCGEE